MRHWFVDIIRICIRFFRLKYVENDLLIKRKPLPNFPTTSLMIKKKLCKQTTYYPLLFLKKKEERNGLKKKWLDMWAWTCSVMFEVFFLNGLGALSHLDLNAWSIFFKLIIGFVFIFFLLSFVKINNLNLYLNIILLNIIQFIFSFSIKL